jgi:XTP/dITP diphosphohydrolase
MLRLLLASNNEGKVRELQSLLSRDDLELVTPDEIGLAIDVIENGSSYAENAALKGLAFSKASGLLTLADDSGLEVDALGGQPGLHSRRFLEKPEASDADRRRLLLQRLQGNPRPWTARFRCVISLVDPHGEIRSNEGTCEGEIIPEERGQNGFGYDPIFLTVEFGRTMAELTMEEKNQISHRARAFRASLPALEELLAIH